MKKLIFLISAVAIITAAMYVYTQQQTIVSSLLLENIEALANGGENGGGGNGGIDNGEGNGWYFDGEEWQYDSPWTPDNMKSFRVVCTRLTYTWIGSILCEETLHGSRVECAYGLGNCMINTPCNFD